MQTGDPEPSAAQTSSVWTSEASLADVRVWLAAGADPSDESMRELLSLVPAQVLAQAIA